MKKSQKHTTTRRSFIKHAAAASTLFIVPRHVLGGSGYVAPSDQINLAAVGIGGKGRTDLLHAALPKNVRVVGLCDVDTKGKGQRDILKSIEDFPKAHFYKDFRRMLDQEKDIDAVTIATPDHTHASISVYAMERSKHIYVQKPLTHNVKEARILTEMAREKQVVTQMGNQGASNPDQLQIQKWVDSGVIGTIKEVKVWTNRPVWPQGIPMPQPNASLQPEGLDWDLWLGPARWTEYTPEMHPFNWRGWWQYGTGALGDMGCHLIDVPFRALGLQYPTAVECSVGSVYRQMWVAEHLPEGCPPASFVSLNFESTQKNPVPIQLTWTDGGIRPPHPDLIPPNEDLGESGGNNGVMMIGEMGIITSGVYGLNPRLYRAGEPVQKAPRVSSYEPEYGHHRKWIDAIVAGFDSAEHKNLTSSFDYAGPLTETVLMGNIAIRSYLLRKKKRNGRMDYYARKKLLWDGKAMKITNLEEANQFVTRSYRKGWEV
ncbi:MAG: Gfo/Idh/MocA family protein [Flavobacteriaceae bacterium]